MGIGIRILAVDDDEGTRIAFQAIARIEGWSLFACGHDVAVWDQFYRFDVLILDHCPQSKYELLLSIREAGLWLPALIIVSGTPIDMTMLMNLDAIAVIPKPFDLAALREAITIVRRRKEEDMNRAWEFLRGFATYADELRR